MKNIKSIIAAIAMIILIGMNINVYANNKVSNIETNNIVGESYEREKISSDSIQKQIQNNDLPKEAIQDLEGLKNIKILKLKTNSSYEIALAYSNGDYTFLGTANNIDEAIQKANEAKSKVKSDVIPAVINKDGLVVYATESIGRIVKIIDGQPSTNKGNVTEIYKKENTSTVHAQVAHEYIDDVPIIIDNGKRVKVQLNGFTGYIEKEDKNKNINIIVVPINQVKNFSYYTKTSAGSLNHYISSDITTSGKGDTIQIGIAPSMLEIGKKYYSYDCKYFYENINDLISDLRNNTNGKAINKKDPYYNYYTNIPMRYKTLYSVEEINNYITKNTTSDSVLRNKGKAIVEAQNNYGISANIILSIAMNESSKGTSRPSKELNNIFGMTNENGNYAKFNNIEDCIKEFTYEFMHNGFLNPKSWKYNGSNLGNKNFGANVRYATDPYWGEKAANYMYDMDKYISSGNQLIEYNRYNIGKINSVDNVTNQKGQILYDIIKERTGIWNQWAYGQVGDMIIALSDKNGKYEMYPDRQAPMDEYYRDPYDFSKIGFINKSSVDIINTKSQNVREFTNVAASDLNITSTKLTGKAPYESNVKVIVNGTQVGSTVNVNTNETYSINIPNQKPNTSIVVEFSKTGYKTHKVSKNVLNIFDTFSVDSITNKGTELTGKGVSGSTVQADIGNTQIGKNATVDSNGNYKIEIPYQKTNETITVKMSKSGYETKQKSTKVIGITTGSKKSLTTDIYKYDVGKEKYLTYINKKGYSQYSYLNTSGKYAFTPSSWMTAAGLSVSMPTSINGYTMTIDNNYIELYNDAKSLLNNIKLGKISKSEAQNILSKLELREMNKVDSKNEETKISTKALPKKTLTNDIYKYDIGEGKYLTYINGKGYSQYVYLNTSGKYAFTPSSWMTAAGLNVIMQTSSNGYTMKIDNSYLTKYNNTVKEIKNNI